MRTFSTLIWSIKASRSSDKKTILRTCRLTKSSSLTLSQKFPWLKALWKVLFHLEKKDTAYEKFSHKLPRKTSIAALYNSGISKRLKFSQTRKKEIFPFLDRRLLREWAVLFGRLSVMRTKALHQLIHAVLYYAWGRKRHAGMKIKENSFNAKMKQKEARKGNRKGVQEKKVFLRHKMFYSYRRNHLRILCVWFSKRKVGSGTTFLWLFFCPIPR